MTNTSPASDRYNDQTYLKANPGWHMEDSRWKAAQVRRMIAKHQLHPARIAEVGCGAGEILLDLSSAWPHASLHGFEISEDVFAICKQKESEQVKFLCEEITGTDAAYDLVLCLDVMEHVENYIQFVRDLRPTGDYKLFHIPLDIHLNAMLRDGFARSRLSAGHLHYFTAETAIATLRDVGYHIIDYHHTPAFDSEGQHRAGQARSLLRTSRRLLYKLSPAFLSKTLGGCSLLVLAR